MMRKYSKTVGALVAASTLVAGFASANEFEGEVHIGGASDYIFRGADLGHGLAEAGADVSTDLGAGFTLSAGLWYASIQDSGMGNLPFATIPDHYSELDLYTELSKDFGWATAYVGYIWYHYQDTEISGGGFDLKLIDDSQEVYFGLGREIAWGINGALTYYWAVEGDNGGYTELKLDKTWDLHECVNLNFGVKTGYYVEEGQLAHVTPTLTLNIKVKDNFTISPYIAYSVELDGLDEVAGNNKIQNLLGVTPDEGNHLYGGVKLAVSF